MRKITSIVTALIVFLSAALIFVPIAGASAAGYTLTPILPENQDPGSRGYYDLWVTPGQRQEITLRVNNVGDKEIEVVVDVFTATTNLNGIVDYTAPGFSDETLKYNLSEIITLDNEAVNIPVDESRDIVLTLAMPDEDFEGILLGAIRTAREPTQAEIDASGMIVERFSNVIPIKIRQTETEIAPDFLMGSVTTELVNRRASIVAEVRNPKPRLVTGVAASASIIPKDSDTPIFEMSNIKVDFAPNSIFPFTMVDREGYGLRAGNYIAKIELEHEGTAWQFEEEFEILPEEADTINTGAVNQQQNPGNPLGSSSEGTSLMAILGIGGGIILIALVAIILLTNISKRKAYSALRQERLGQLGQQGVTEHIKQSAQPLDQRAQTQQPDAPLAESTQQQQQQRQNQNQNQNQEAYGQESAPVQQPTNASGQETAPVQQSTKTSGQESAPVRANEITDDQSYYPLFAEEAVYEVKDKPKAHNAAVERRDAQQQKAQPEQERR